MAKKYAEPTLKAKLVLQSSVLAEKWKKKPTTKRKNGQLARLLIIQRALSPGSSFSNRTLVP